MVKADGNYDSAIIDPYGRILELAVFPDGGEATLLTNLQIGDGHSTLTTLLGERTGWIGLLGLLLFSFGSQWLSKEPSL